MLFLCGLPSLPRLLIGCWPRLIHATDGQISHIVEVQLVKGNRGQEWPAECIDGIRNNQPIIGVIGGRPRESRHRRWCGDVWIVRSWCIIASWAIIGAHWDVASDDRWWKKEINASENGGDGG